MKAFPEKMIRCYVRCSKCHTVHPLGVDSVLLNALGVKEHGWMVRSGCHKCEGYAELAQNDKMHVAPCQPVTARRPTKRAS
jgi:hypothetical protein